MRDDLNIPFPETAGPGDGFGRVSYGTRQSGMDQNTRRLALIAAGIGGALLLVVGVWSVLAPRQAGIPIVQADKRPLREKPLNKGGLNIMGADEQGLAAEPGGKAVVAPAPEAPALAALQATETSKPTPAPVTEAAPEPPKVTPVTEAAPAPEPKPPVAVAPPAPRLAVTATPAPAPVVIPPAPHPAAKAGGRQVQLAAVGSQEAAQAEWQRLARKYPDLLGNRQLEVSRVDHGGKVFWRVRTGGFADQASASAFCSQIKAKGAACDVPRA